MAVRIQIRRDTASNWVTNNPMLYPGEIGLETDTLQFKVGPAVESPAVGTAWNSIAEYANVVPGDLNSTLNGYLEVTDIGAAGGVVGLNNSKDAIIPGSSIIIEGSTNDAFETTLTVTDPTADRVLTLPDATGTIATEGYVDTAISEFDALPTQTGNNGKFLQTNGSTTTWATVDLSTKQDKVTGVSDTEIGYLDGVTSSIQDQLDDKLDSATASTTYQAIVAGVSDTEIGYLNGVTSAIQDQLDDKFASADASTTNITEGTNLYFTNERAQDAVAAMITDSTHTGISVSYTDNGSSEGDLSFTNTGVTSLTGTTNEVTVSSSTGGVTIGLPDNVTIANNLVVSGDLDVQGTTKTTYTATVATHDNLIYLNQAQDAIITNAVGDGTYVTYTAENNYDPGMDIRIIGMDPAGYNISSADGLTIYSANGTQFVVAKTTTGSFVSGGTAHAKSEANADLGFAGGYYDAGYAHAGLFRDATDGKFKIFDGYTPEPDEEVNIDTTHASFALADFVAGSIEATSATIGDVSNTELQYLNGVTSAIQTQLDDKSTASKTETFTNKTLTSPKINENVALTATATELNTLDGITASTSELNILDGATLTTTELNYVDGVTSSIQTQIDAKVSKSGGDTITNSTTTTVPLTIQTMTGNSANFMQFKRQDGFVQSRITANGEYYAPVGIKTGAKISSLENATYTGFSSPDGYPTLPSVIIQGIDSQTGDLLQLKDNSNTKVLAITPAGVISDGIWEGTKIDAAHGGTGLTGPSMAGDLIYSTTNTDWATLSPTSPGEILTIIESGSDLIPSWQPAPITLPDQSGNNGKYLTTDGTDASWGELVIPISTGTATLTGNTAASVDSFSLVGQSIEYTVSLSQGSKRRTSKVLVSCTGSAVDMTEFAIIEMGGAMSGVQITATESASSGNLEIVVTDAASTNVTVKFTKTEI